MSLQKTNRQENGVFRKRKVSFSMVSNTVLQADISLAAKGLYSVLCTMKKSAVSEYCSGVFGSKEQENYAALTELIKNKFVSVDENNSFIVEPDCEVLTL